MALRLRVLMAYGARITDTRVSASLGDLQPQEHQPFTGRLGLFPRHVFDVRFTPEQVAQRLRELRPEIVTGFPSSIQRVVECLSPADRAIIRPRFVTTASEMLFPHMREPIAAQFQCPVYNLYGAAEANLIAWECPSTGYLHVMDHSLIVQIESHGRAAAPGEEGEVVLTLLHCHAMPFIRYKLGDIAIPGPCPCPCGHGSATIAALRGRAVHLLTGKDGRPLNAIVVVTAVRALVPGLRRFQIEQTAVDVVTIRIVVAQPLTGSALLHAENAISTILEHRFHIRLQPVDEIADPTGRKLQYFVPLRNGEPNEAANK